ncbi:hypothetical protein [Paenibacillus sacheonensis]|uniref:Uncharacterized protein n=1 Tax=Paenibacillus sacheonensis TaxID=742054 RepID=A0A7X4YQK0_9BACL|nr:hypothetical protein [Paenibacillus sacheonensis]MBM7566694.1 hypothetical protein [Paenibacillus sacheonensis]NBC70673.1 hypothetical protein [Paenibacillus sacheonensis]
MSFSQTENLKHAGSLKNLKRPWEAPVLQVLSVMKTEGGPDKPWQFLPNDGFYKRNQFDS